MPFFVVAPNGLIHFNADWLDFVFVGAKIEIFFFCAWEKNWIFLENVYFCNPNG